MIDLTGIRARLADYQRQLDIRQSVALHSDEWGHAQMLAEEYAEFLANAMPAVLARVDELEAALRPLTDPAPVYYDDRMYRYECLPCGASSAREETIDHEDDCAWIRAMAVLGGDA